MTLIHYKCGKRDEYHIFETHYVIYEIHVYYCIDSFLKSSIDQVYTRIWVHTFMSEFKYSNNRDVNYNQN